MGGAFGALLPRDRGQRRVLRAVDAAGHDESRQHPLITRRQDLGAWPAGWIDDLHGQVPGEVRINPR